ncbi:hypothetical protein E4K67_29035 [Desulfosporosinus fructosivorans]|uniref:Geranylgeranyl transferase type II subunit beta n=1 Tax=Desulfosporosinus fructosivorans TaxID=2018669 RepID=A0A4Z0QVD1_9FIRM|nr:hypothetical protein [Desulfosporosinus fructosivorans]TGE34742.1 hypothetical protein E4K67_29035 [Desulfosporosinus fructosivorans]
MIKILRINSAITVRNVMIIFFILTVSLTIFSLYNTSIVWKSNTLNIFYKSENTDGGFSSLLCERKPFIYDTYYNNLFLMESNKLNPKTNGSLKSHLYNSQKEIKDISSVVILYDLSYLVDLQKKCGISFNDSYKQSIIKYILKLHNKDTGLFAINDSNIIESIGVTNACTKILSNLDYDFYYNNLNITINGLYEDPSIFNTSNNKWPIFNNLNAIEERIQISTITEKGIQFKNKLILDAKELLSKKPTDIRALANYIPAYELLRRLNINTPISEEFKSYLESVRNVDGGYGFLSSKTSDSQLTYRIYLLFPELVSVNDYINSIEKYRLKSGYFISREPIDSNIPHSYMALKIIKYLDGKIPSNLINYIQQASLNKTLDPDEFYFMNKALSELGLSNVSYGNISDNDSKLMIYELITCNNIDPMEKERVINTLKNLKKADGGYSFTEGSNLKDTYLILLAMTYVNETDTTSALIDWLLSMQKEDGGYSSEEDSNLMDTYYVLSIMNCIRYKPQNINMFENYINSKRDNENGGFSFSPNSISSIKATFYGLESEFLLKKLRTFNT